MADTSQALEEKQSRRNRESADRWGAFANHRTIITQTLLELGANRISPRLCALGAGNCNDIDLKQLSSTFAEIHLVDWDSAALSAGVERQGADPAIVRVYGDIDLSGVSRIPAVRDTDEEARVAFLSQYRPPFAENGFDVVASLCLLSQLFEPLLERGEDSAQALLAIQALRLNHLDEMLRRTRPGGWALLVTDVVSSESAPELPSIADDQLAECLRRWIERKNFFTGLNPAVLQAEWTRHPRLASRIDQFVWLNPWKWNLGPRWYAVIACAARKSLASGIAT